MSDLFLQQFEVQFRLAFGLVGVDGANVLLGFHLVAALDGDILKVGIDRKVFAMANDDHGVAARQFGDVGHLALKDGTGVGVLRGGNVDAVVGHGHFARHHRGVFAVRR